MKTTDVKTKDITVFETKDYQRFKKVKGNRPINKGQIKKMIRAIKGEKINIMHAAPILVDDKYQIVDGQHRFHVCKELKLPIYYIKNGNIKIQGIAKINSNTSTWKTADFINCFDKLGNQHYKHLKRYLNNYPIPASSAIPVLMNGNAKRHAGNIMQTFKDGDFKVNYKVFADEIGAMVDDFKPYIQRVTTPFIDCLCRLNRSTQYDHEVMMAKLKKRGTEIPQQEKVKSWISELEKAYNFHNQKLQRII